MPSSQTSLSRGHAGDFFEGVAWKHLRRVDMPERGSNQHEIGGVATLKKFLGGSRRERIRSRWRVFDNEGQLVDTIIYNRLTWYDCRESQPHRSAEWRLYYPSGDTPLDDSHEGDLILISKPGILFPDADYDLLCYLIPQEAGLHNEVLWALGLPEATERFRSESSDDLKSRDLQVLQRDVLQRLEPEVQAVSRSSFLQQRIEEAFKDFLAAPLDMRFPSTSRMAGFAHQYLSEDPGQNPDAAIVELLDIESQAFYRLEKAMLQERLATGFESVDGFISFSLSVQNRRKARRGRSLEHHLAHIFSQSGIAFEEQVKTEHSTVDFMFPGEAAYEALKSDGVSGVVMLAAKTTCKDRWRQVLNEAQALKRRYLFTLEAAISSGQTAEMGEAKVSLVVPEEIRSSYGEPGTEVLTLTEFIERTRAELQ